MQNFAEFMAESYRSKIPLVWNLLGRSHLTARFNVDSVKVTVTFERTESADPWHVLFEVDKGQRTDTDLAHSSFAIFNGVFQAVEEFVEIREPDTLLFATKRQELAGIYQTYLRREAATLEKLGYRLEGPLRADPYTEFMLRRTKPSEWQA